jgi:hypothetical protein
MGEKIKYIYFEFTQQNVESVNRYEYFLKDVCIYSGTYFIVFPCCLFDYYVHFVVRSLEVNYNEMLFDWI